MAHAALKTGALLSVLAASAPAGAQTGFQAAVHGGAECPIGCDDVDPLIGATAFVVPGRVGAVGAIYEYVHTQAERNTSLMRYGLAVRGYVVRGELLQPYVQLAFGAARYEERSGGCEYEGLAFLQVGGGLEARIGGDWFCGIGTGVSFWGAESGCEGPATSDAPHPQPRDRSPAYLLAVSLRYGPSS